MRVPKLRFKEFNENWTVRTLGELFDIVVGFVGTVSNSYCEDHDGVLFVRTLNVREGRFSLNEIQYVTLEFHEKNKKSQIYNDDILIARVGANMGMVCKVTGLNSEANSANVIIIKNNPKINSDFYSLYLNSPKGQKQIQTKGAGGAQEVLNISVAKTINVPVPSLLEQTKIANFLTAIDEKITQLTQKCDLLAQYKKGVMQQIFSQKLRFKDDDGHEFPEWENKKIGDIFKFKQGIQCSIENQFMEMDDSKVRFIRIVDLTNYQEPRRYIENPGRNYLLKPDELFMVRYGSPGLVGYGLEGTIANNLFRIIAINKDIIFSKFYFYFFSFFKNKILQLSSSSTMPALNFDSLGMLEITLLSLPEQTKIANFLTAIDDKITQAQAQLEAVKHYKKGLLQQLFI